MFVKRLVAMAAVCFLCIATGIPVFAQEMQADFTFSASAETVQEGDEVRVAVTAEEFADTMVIAGFRLRAEYDASKLTLKRVDTSSQMQSGTFRYHTSGDGMTGIYVCDGAFAPQLTGECLTLVFRVNQEPVFGETSVSVKMDQLVDWNAVQLPSTFGSTVVFRIAPEFAKEAVLTKLIPNQGVLEPMFDADIQEYSMQVGAEVTEILFDMEAADGATARVNRKNLEKQGSVTQFIITVTSADRKNKSKYTVNVTRGEKVAVGTDTSTTKSKTTSSKTENEAQTEDVNRAVYYGDRNLYMIGDQMPSYLIYMIVGGAGVLTAVIVGLVVMLMRKKGKFRSDSY